MTAIPANAATTANNISLYKSQVEKSPGSAKYNPTALPAGIVGIYDWWPTPTTQNLIALTSAGNIYRDSGDQTFNSNTAFAYTEVQKIVFVQVPQSGNFQITVGGTSLTVPYTATAASFQAQIRAISGYSNITVSGNFALGFSITFTGVVSPPLSTSTTTATENVTNTAITWPGTTTLFANTTQRIKFSAAPTSGKFNLTYNGNTSGDILFSASAGDVQTAIQALPGLSAATVGSTYTLGFNIVPNSSATQTSTNPFLFTVTGNTLMAAGAVTTQVAPLPTAISISKTSTGKTNLGPLTPDVHMVQGGAELPGNNRKLFIFTGSNQVQVLNGNGAITADMSQPAADWATNYPTFGIIYQGRLFSFGNSNNPHTLYISSLSDHENFLSPKTAGTITSADPAQYPIFNGEGDGLVSAYVYKGTLLLFKKPFGVYSFYWPDTSQIPEITRYTDSFGISSPHGAAPVLDDMITLSNSGTLVSLKAVQAFGNFESGDVLQNTRTRNYFRDQLSAGGNATAHAVYYPEKQIAYFTGRSGATTAQNRMIVMDVSRETPRMTLETKDQPTCLSLRRDTNKVPRPMYGADDGFVYLMDQSTRSVGSTAYAGEFQTPNLDFGFMDQTLANKNKIFDFLTVDFEFTGNWNFSIDVFIEGNFVETLTYVQFQGGALDAFKLDFNTLGSVQNKVSRQRLHCTGKSVAFKIYNNQLNQYFKVSKLVVDFRTSGEQAKSSK